MRLVGVNCCIGRSRHCSLPDLVSRLRFLYYSLCVGCQDNYDPVVMTLRCGCSRLWLDKKDKSYVCPSHLMLVSWCLVMLNTVFFCIIYISWNRGNLLRNVKRENLNEAGCILHQKPEYCSL